VCGWDSVGQAFAAHLRANTGAPVLAMRNTDGTFITNPSTGIALQNGQIIIAIGTDSQLEQLREASRPAPSDFRS
jgi:K+/H+ antiporter YhaU regulatory subunit KhtT